MDGRAVKEKPLHVPCRGSIAGVLVLWTEDPFVEEGMRKDMVEEVLSFARERSKFYTEQVRAGVYGDYKI